MCEQLAFPFKYNYRFICRRYLESMRAEFRRDNLRRGATTVVNVANNDDDEKSDRKKIT
jgi:hypothetical protein